MKYRTVTAAMAAVLGVYWSVGASAADLTIGVATEPTSLDPHFQALNSNHELSMHVYETMMRQDPQMRLLPSLATSWKPIDPNTWEFKLRQGVKFHNGTPFTARDVVFSIERAPKVPNAPATYRRRVAQVESAKAVDDHTVHIRTKAPTPLLPENLAQLPIVSETVGMDAEPAQFNDGSKAFGTGPYRFNTFARGDRITFTANPNWWGGKPKWDNVTFRWITSAPARTAALLSGDVDVIASVSTTDVAKLEDDPRVNVSATASTRLIYWSLDVGSETTPNVTAKNGDTIPNPLRDLRVRKALTLAVDRNAIADNVMEGLAVPTNQIVAEGFGGYHEGIAVPDFDPAKAKKLLAEAGYPNGFNLTIHATNDRYVNDAKLAQAIAQMYAQVGVDVKVETMPVAVYYGKARGHEFAMCQIGWATATGESSAILSPALRKGKRNNYGRWENAEFNTVIKAALSTVNLEEYRAGLARATEIVAEEIPIIPTHNQVAVWAARKGLTYGATANEATLAEAVSAE
jgi:peptide/nickel transport system substrate-binding protein